MATDRVSGVGDPKALADQLLKNTRLTLSSQAKQDLERTRDGKPLGACGVTTLDASLLQLLVKAVEKYTISINHFVTGLPCDTATGNGHPQGKAMDISSVNGNPVRLGNAPDFDGNFTTPAFSPALAKEFVVFMANSMPAGKGGIGQVTCTAVRGANLPNDVDKFGDKCDHFHIDVRDTTTET